MRPRETTRRFPTPPDPDPPPSLARVEVGDRLLVEARSDTDAVIRTERGRAARLSQPYACFVHASGEDRDARRRAWRYPASDE